MRNALALVAILLVGLVAFTAFGSDGAGVADVDVFTARGVALKATVHRPAKGNGAAVVIAPGQGYHRELPIVRRSAEALAEAGFVVVRFDWAYFTGKAQPSEDFAKEAADVDAAVAFARKQEGVTKVLLVGKSLGSIVGLAWTNAHKDAVAGLALLTYVTTNNPDAANLAKVDVPTLVVCGDHDPQLDPAVLYGIAAKAPRPPQIVIVPGDHGLTTGDKSSPETVENVELAVRHLVLWAKRRVTEK